MVLYKFYVFLVPIENSTWLSRPRMHFDSIKFKKFSSLARLDCNIVGIFLPLSEVN
jgi:hypothetical protein